MTSALLAIVLGWAPGPAAMAAERDSGPTPPRLSFLDGEVSFWRPGAEDWARAQRNMPLAAGDALYTDGDGNVEVQVGPAAFVRAGSGTELGLESLENGVQQFRVTAGHAAVDTRRIPKDQAIEIDTPHGAFTIDQPGYYRVDVDETRTTFITRRGGRASVIPAQGDERDIDPDTQLTLEGTDAPQVATARAPESDEWDRWNLGRGQARPERPRSAQYVPADVAGADELDEYGDWREEPQYGHVWVPRVAAGWVPYSTGRWVWDPYYGWTWIDDAPWGWAPFHYGRWVFVHGYWGWTPGPIVVAPAYSPALVAFYSGPHVTVSIGTPFVSWVALGWGEPVIPWWGPVGFHGHCWWGGWGGPRVVNNVVIQRNTYVNVRNVNTFRNARYERAIVGVDEHRFGRGRVEHVRFDRAEARRLRPVHGRIGVRPTAASLVPHEGRGRRPPEQVHARPVVATRPPQDPSRHLRAAGLNAPPTSAPARIVRQPARAHGETAGVRRGGSDSGTQPRAGFERGDRQTPPVPRAEHGRVGGARPGHQPRPPVASRPGREQAPAVHQPARQGRFEAPDTPRARRGGGSPGVETPQAPRSHPGAASSGQAPRTRPAPRAHGTPSDGGFAREQQGGYAPRQTTPSAPHVRPSSPPTPTHGGARESAPGAYGGASPRGSSGGMHAPRGGAAPGGGTYTPPVGGSGPHGGGPGGPSARHHERRGRET